MQAALLILWDVASAVWVVPTHDHVGAVYPYPVGWVSIVDNGSEIHPHWCFVSGENERGDMQLEEIVSCVACCNCCVDGSVTQTICWVIVFHSSRIEASQNQQCAPFGFKTQPGQHSLTQQLQPRQSHTSSVGREIYLNSYLTARAFPLDSEISREVCCDSYAGTCALAMNPRHGSWVV